MTRERGETLPSLSEGLVLHLSPPFVGWPIPANLLLTCDL